MNGNTYPAQPIPGEYNSQVFKKTVYDPDVVSDSEFIRRGLEAANNATRLPDGTLPGEWEGVDSLGVKWVGHFRDGNLITFYPAD